MGIDYRIGTDADALGVAELYLVARKTFLPYAPLIHSEEEVKVWVKDILIPSGGVTVVQTGDKVVGMMAVSHDGTYGWLDHLYLDPAAVGKGIGSALLQHAKKTLAAPIRLYTFQQNANARRFYKQHGFREIALTDGATNEEKIPDVLLEWIGSAR